LPKKLTDTPVNRIENPVLLKNDDGRIWPMNWELDDGFVLFKEKFSDINQILRIRNGDILSFSYNGGNTVEMKRMF